MNPDYWKKRWNEGKIGFHQANANPLLVQHLDRLELESGSRVFVPLCGKTTDIAWLLAQGFQVVGIELSEIAVQDLFADLQLSPTIIETQGLLGYSAPKIEVFVGDIFHLDRGTLGTIDAVYDRAALVALPEDMRKRYCSHLSEITDGAPQLLITYEYDQKLFEGPPFSISQGLLEAYYSRVYNIDHFESKTVKGGIRANCPATENLWKLTPAGTD
ncbi:MAG: thiopurine S-methyltransferase [Leptospiraceae bacterium]|nr:thiopurine S-methyltransferase [Leptospiraceae bacterium]